MSLFRTLKGMTIVTLGTLLFESFTILQSEQDSGMRNVHLMLKGRYSDKITIYIDFTAVVQCDVPVVKIKCEYNVQMATRKV